MDLPFESLPQREAKQRRRRKGGSNEEAPEQPGEQPGPSSSAAEAGAARAAAASTPTGDLAGAAAAALNGLALHERAQPGASTSAPAGADEGLPRLRYTECPEYRSCAVGGNKYECERSPELHSPAQRAGDLRQRARRRRPCARGRLRCATARLAHGRQLSASSRGTRADRELGNPEVQRRALHQLAPLPPPTCANPQTWTTLQTCSSTHVRAGRHQGWHAALGAWGRGLGALPAQLQGHRATEAAAPTRPAAHSLRPALAAAGERPGPSPAPHRGRAPPRPTLPTARAGGATLEEAFGNAGLAMFNYMTPLEGIAIDPGQTRWPRARRRAPRASRRRRRC